MTSPRACTTPASIRSPGRRSRSRASYRTARCSGHSCSDYRVSVVAGRCSVTGCFSLKLSMSASRTIPITSDLADLTLAALLRRLLSDHSWGQIRRLIETRRVKIEGELCLDPARRLREGLTVELLDRPAAKPHQHEDVVIRHLDEHVVVIEKPSGMNTVRHPAEREWTERRKALSPTLEDIVPRL